MKNPPVLICTTVACAADAQAIAEKLLAKRLAACVSSGSPTVSRYVWQNQTRCETEIALHIKTSADCAEKTMRYLREIHPYTCPEILAFACTAADKDYAAWIDAQTAPLDPPEKIT